MFSFGIPNIVEANIWIDILTARIEELKLNETRMKEQINELEHLVTIDPLTCVYNRRFLDNYLQQMQSSGMEQERRSATNKFSILLIDIDDFKIINDNNTHVVGDGALRYTAGTISSALRKGLDICGRYGGDEFLVVTWSIAIIDAYNLALRIKDKIKKSNGQNITVSIGVAEYLKGESVEELVARASSAVNEKHVRGRDSVYVNVCYINGAYINYKL